MPRIQLSDRAHEDLREIWQFITRDKKTAADRLIRDIDAALAE
ncbi:MAG TPA: hypothetical protein VD978_05130 [Azospirillum sp.]|nr:hypothetical protein [Azospirillum sp.]